ncbi:MAG TPA: SRPBCC domain-containing protein [Acidimicrobiales bacterium]|nr:SRPBCC domain-containing protein [Acidimicrobiales bacterium]
MRATFPVSAPPDAWAALTDPLRLAAALPGCRSVTPDADGDGALHVVTEVAVASVRGLWAGTVAPVDADAVRVRGSGAPGGVDLVVRADAARTMITVEGTVDGPLGTVGSTVLAAALRRTAEDLLAAAAPASSPDAPGQPHPPAVAAGPAVGATVPAPRAVGAGRRRVIAATAVGAAVTVIAAGRRRMRRRAG